MAMRPAGRGRPTPRGRSITARYLGILAAEGVIGPRDVDLAPRIALTDAEPAEGERTLGPECRPVVLVPSAGMAVKEWPYWRELATALAGCAFVVGEQRVLDAWCGGPARLLPPLHLRTQAAVFALWDGAAASSSARTPARCGWRPRSAPAPWGSSARRWPRATGWARAASTGRACPAARNAARPPSPSRCAGGTAGALSATGPACMADVPARTVVDLVRGRQVTAWAAPAGTAATLAPR